MNPLVAKYGSDPRWLNWRPEKKNNQITKVPLGSSTDPATWSLYKKLKGTPYGKGIVFTPDRLLLGVDIDHCLDPKTKKITHEQKDKIEALIDRANTYCEISPSGEGLHIFLECTEALDLEGNKHAPFEIYNVGRYFTVTEKPFDGKGKEVRRVTRDEATDILSIIGYPWKDRPSNNTTRPNNPGKKLTDSEVLDKATRSKNGDAFSKLYNGDTSNHQNDDSSADLALCNYLAFWTQGDHSQIERLWLNSPLGSRKKTQTRADYRELTIREAISKCREFYTPRDTTTEIELELLFKFNKDGDKVFTQNTENVCRILRYHAHFKSRLRYDTFKNILEYRSASYESWRLLEDVDAITIQTEISVIFDIFQKIGKDMVYDAMIKVAKENAIDSARDYITALEWDHEPRLAIWLTKTYGCPDDAYHRAVGSNWLKGLVSRILRPGSKFDYVLVLEGRQGSKKSTSLAVLGRDWHVETTMGTDHKDFFMQFQGKAIIEFSEGETLSRTEVKRMKAIISTQVDSYRPPYGRQTVDYPRRCVFAMTTNQEEYLKDETGNRRWLPVRLSLPEADVSWLSANRDQLFAEARHRLVTLHETIYEFPLEETLRAQEERRVSDPNTDAVVDWYYDIPEKKRDEGITVDQAAKEALHMGFSGPIRKFEEMSIGNIFRETLGLTQKQVMVNGTRRRRWYPDPLKDMQIKVVDKDAVQK